MKLATEKQGILSRLARDRGGNFGMMTALLIPVLFGVGGMSIDLTKMMMTKTRLQDAADSAALAAASALANNPDKTADEKTITDAAKKLALKLLQTQMSEGSLLGEEATVEQKKQIDDLELELASATSIQIDPVATKGTGKSYTINISTSYNMELNPLTRLLVKDKATIVANSTAESATESKAAISMVLVLDRSGSMSWITGKDPTTNKYSYEDPTYNCKNYTEANWEYKDVTSGKNKIPLAKCIVSKISALKTAVKEMATYLDGVDPPDDEFELVRTGAVAYSHEVYTATPLAWGTTPITDYVSKIPARPEGSTDSSGAFEIAFNMLDPEQSSEDQIHKDKNGQKPTKYIVFMTDGENNYFNGRSTRTSGDDSDTKTELYCSKAKDAGIQVFTVAFMAPDRGETLLQNCASSYKEKDPEHDTYFEPGTVKQLVLDFKKIGEKAVAVVARLTQ